MDLRKKIWLPRLAIVGWWVLFVLITSLVGTITSILRGDESSFFGNLSWHGFWLIWCGLSFLAIYLARRFPIEVGTLKRDSKAEFGDTVLFGVRGGDAERGDRIFYSVFHS